MDFVGFTKTSATKIFASILSGGLFDESQTTLKSKIPLSARIPSRILDARFTKVCRVSLSFCSKRSDLAILPMSLFRRINNRETLILLKDEDEDFDVLSPKRNVPSPMNVTTGLMC